MSTKTKTEERWAVICRRESTGWTGQAYAWSESEAREKYDRVIGWWKEWMERQNSPRATVTIRLVKLDDYDAFLQFSQWPVIDQICLEKGCVNVHTKDGDCTPDAFGICTICGVGHGAPCVECGQKAFHRAGCTLSDAYLSADSFHAADLPAGCPRLGAEILEWFKWSYRIASDEDLAQASSELLELRKHHPYDSKQHEWLKQADACVREWEASRFSAQAFRRIGLRRRAFRVSVADGRTKSPGSDPATLLEAAAYLERQTEPMAAVANGLSCEPCFDDWQAGTDLRAACDLIGSVIEHLRTIALQKTEAKIAA